MVRKFNLGIKKMGRVDWSALEATDWRQAIIDAAGPKFSYDKQERMFSNAARAGAIIVAVCVGNMTEAVYGWLAFGGILVIAAIASS